MDRVAVSTWALHHWLGADTVNPERRRELGPALAANGFSRVEICHFHLFCDPAERLVVADALRSNGITLQTLLIDAGDVTDPATAAADEALIAEWIEIAIAMGFDQARVIAGKQPWTKESSDRSVDALNRLAKQAEGRIRLVIENWFDLLQTPAQVHEILDRTDGQIGLNGDFGNWSGADKYDRLAGIMGRAEACHAKCDSDAQLNIDVDDYLKCLELSENAGYDGPYTLVHGAGLADPWEFLSTQRGLILANTAAG